MDKRLQQMTLEEKVSLLSGADHWHTKAVERLGIGRIMMSCRTTSYQSGMVMEKMDFHSWLKHIKNDVKI